MPELPAGTVTFLFTGIASLAALHEQDARAMPDVLARHALAWRTACAAHAGYVFKAGEGSLSAAFARTGDALQAALEAQRRLSAHEWPAGLRPRARAVIHAGPAQERGGDYFGPAVHHTQCLLVACHGGQVLLSSAAAEQLQSSLPAEVTLRDLGERRLRDMSRPERLFQVVAPGLAEAFPLPRTLDQPPGNLPEQTSGLIGRAQEVAAVRALLRRPGARMVTLTGAAGAGKTRLALQVGALLLDEFASGAFFVPLAPARDPERAVSAIARVLGVKENRGKSLWDSVKEYLRPREVLLVLDNLEQVMSAVPYAADLLAAAPWVKVLTTSRAPTHLIEEHPFHVPPLALPDLKRLPPVAALAAYPALQLFLARARAAQPAFALSEDNARQVAEICVRLDGLPLAIELAAARVVELPLAAMQAQLSGGGTAALEMLAGGSHDLPERQQALRSAMDWSYTLLSEPEQRLFALLAVFVGGCTLEAVKALYGNEQVSGEAPAGSSDAGLPPLLAALMDKNMLQQSGQRYLLLETLREYALERLEAGGEAETLRRLHAEHYRALAEQAMLPLMGADQREWLERLEADHDNMRAALGWSLSTGTPELALRIAAAVWRFWIMHGHLTEGRHWLIEALTQTPGADPAVRAEALNGAGVLTWRHGNLTQATAWFEASLALRRALGDAPGMASSLNNLGVMASDQGDFARAEAMYTESLALFRAANHAWGVANGLNNLGQVARSRGDYARAADLYHESLTRWREIGYDGGAAMVLANLGHITHSQGDDAAARAFFNESLTLRRELGDRHGVAECLAGLAAVAAGHRDYERAAQLCGTVHAHLEAIDASLEPMERDEYERTIAAARAALGEAGFAACWGRGRTMMNDERR